MSLDGTILAAARRRFLADREARRAELERRREEIERRLPRVAEIDRELRGAAAQLLLAAFEREEDPEPALRELEGRNLALQRERAEALVGAGYPYDYVDDAPACPQCQDSGCLADGAVCRCLMRYYTQEQNRRLSRLLDLGSQSFETFSFDWYGTQAWESYGRSPRENMEIVFDICTGFARTFAYGSGNLLFTGPPGLGKTFLSACIAREVSGRGFSVVYDTAAHIFQSFESGKFGREGLPGEDPEREIERCLHCDLLIMDDLGTEMLTSFVQATVYRLVNERLLSRKSTLLSTNLSVQELGRRYGEAVLSRVQGEYGCLVFFGEDIRLLKRDR